MITRDYDLSQLQSRIKPDCKNLPPKYAEELEACFDAWRKHLTRNVMRSRYYRGHNLLKDLGIAIPPQLTDVEEVIGWPAKAVDALTTRSRFDGFRCNTQSVLSEIEDIARFNDLTNGYDTLLPSEGTHGTAFMVPYIDERGDIRISKHSACSGVAVWDYVRNRELCGLTISMLDEKGKPIGYTLWSDDAVVEFVYDGKRWHYLIKPHPLGRPFIVSFSYRPDLDKPFGKSRITRAVLALTDNAVRTLLRGEVTAEFYTHPQRYLLGATEELFSPTIIDEETGEEVPNPNAKTKYEATIDAMLAVERDENGELPEYGQLPATSPQPHIDLMRYYASLFSGETGVPISSLGIIQDNPSSAEAIYAAKEDLIVEAQALNAQNKRSLETVAQIALAMAGDKPFDKLTKGERSVTAYFLDPARPSLVSQADAMTKLRSGTPNLDKTRWYWEQLGCTNEQIDEILETLSDETADESGETQQDQFSEPVSPVDDNLPVSDVTEP